MVLTRFSVDNDIELSCTIGYLCVFFSILNLVFFNLFIILL